MHPRQLDLHLLRAFDALMQEGSVTRAAERLALTQPAVSGLLQRLRGAFDDPLFVRSQRGITPTPRALSLHEPVRQILAAVDRLIAPEVFDPRTAELTLTLAATDYAMRAVVQPFIVALLRQLRMPRRFPRVRGWPVLDRLRARSESVSRRAWLQISSFIFFSGFERTR